MSNQASPKNNRKISKSGQTAILIFLAVILLLTALSILRAYFKGGRFSNPEGTVGNTAGNLNNGGLFCEYNGTVYFANPFDHGTLYAMDPNEENIRFLSGSVVHNLLAGGDHLYYFQTGAAGLGDLSSIASTHGFVRTDLKGNSAMSLTRDVIVNGQLAGDYLYLLSSDGKSIDFYKLRADKSEEPVSLADYSINPSCVADGIMYYTLTGDSHSVYVMDTQTDTPKKLLGISAWNPIVQGDYLYYMDVSSDYRLCRYSFSADKTEILTSDRADCFNVGYGYVYYQKNGAEPQLICMRTDGTDPKVIADGNFHHIHITSQYAYFQEFQDGDLYHSPLGSGSCSLFREAAEAIPKKK